MAVLVQTGNGDDICISSKIEALFSVVVDTSRLAMRPPSCGHWPRIRRSKVPVCFQQAAPTACGGMSQSAGARLALLTSARL